MEQDAVLPVYHQTVEKSLGNLNFLSIPDVDIWKFIKKNFF